MSDQNLPSLPYPPDESMREDYAGEQFTPANAPAAQDQKEAGPNQSAHLPKVPGAAPGLAAPLPLPPLEAEFERLRTLLRRNHQVVGMRLRELAEAQHRDGWPDHSAFKTGLLRLSNETREMEQLLLNIQITAAFPIPKGIIHEHGTAKLRRTL